MHHIRVFLVVFSALSFAAANGQNSEADSLKKLLRVSSESAGKVVLLEGLSYSYLSSFPDTSLRYALEGLELAKRINDKKGEARCMNALGNVYFHVGDYPKALEMYFQNLEIEQQFNNRSKVPSTYFNIASVYTEEEDYQNALHYIAKAKEEDERLKDSSGILFDFYSLGSIFLRMQKNDSALYYIGRSFQLSEILQDQDMKGAILNTFGEAYLNLNSPQEAAIYYRQSIPPAEAVNDNEVLASNYFGLAKATRLLGNRDSAIFYSKKAFFIASESSFLKQVMEISNFITMAFREQRQYDSAFKYQEISISAKDSLFNVDKIRKVQSLKFQELQRTQAIETARAEFRNQVTLYAVIGASLVFLVIAILFWRNSKEKQKANILLSEQKARAEKAFEELKSAQTLLIQSEKMASLGELTAGIAHEIQNPLNFVNNFSGINSELIQELKSEAGSGNQQEVIALANDILQNEERIHHHGLRAAEIIRGMLEHSRNSTGQKELSDINVLAEEYLRLSYNGFHAKNMSFYATMQTNFDPAIGKIEIVPQDLGKVLLNLFNNAFYAMNDPSLQTEGFAPTISVSTKQTNSAVEIRVIDNGRGISPQLAHKIFQPFFTTKPTGEGTGLGLSLSYDIIKSLGGIIQLVRSERSATEFLIVLPV